MAHPATEYWLGFFETSHLHPALRPTVQGFADLANAVAEGPENPSTTEAIKLLVRAKDEACRAIGAAGGLARWAEQQS